MRWCMYGCFCYSNKTPQKLHNRTYPILLLMKKKWLSDWWCKKCLNVWWSTYVFVFFIYKKIVNTLVKKKNYHLLSCSMPSRWYLLISHTNLKGVLSGYYLFHPLRGVAEVSHLMRAMQQGYCCIPCWSMPNTYTPWQHWPPILTQTYKTTPERADKHLSMYLFVS